MTLWWNDLAPYAPWDKPTKTVYVCPSISPKLAGITPKIVYCYNGMLSALDFNYCYPRLSKIKNPSNRILLCDGDGHSVGYPNGYPSGAQFTYILWPHNCGNNNAMCDGHVEKVQFKDHTWTRWLANPWLTP